MPPRESKFLNSIGEHHDSAQRMGPSPSQHDPFNVAIDLAYCRLDGIWPNLAAIIKSASLPPFVDVRSSSVEVTQVRLAEARYECKVMHRFDSTSNELPPSLVQRYTTKHSKPAALPDEPRPETPIIWHTDRKFSLQLSGDEDGPHALEDFLLQTSSDLQLEYARIQRRVHEDPGTAGDEGEENWKEIFDRWLPATYHVRTKGRILTRGGLASPQVDVVVLNPDYPAALRSKKLYFAEGVVAAFECKLTLRRRHFESIRKLAKFIGDTSEHPSSKTGVQHARSRPIFGVLAHSSEWDQQSGIGGLFDQFQRIQAVEQHPREAIDVLHIADNCTWTHELDIMSAGTADGPHNMQYRIANPSVLHTQYLRWQSGEDNMSQVAPLYLLIRKLWQLFAAVDPKVANLAGHLQASPLTGVEGNFGVARAWPLDVIQIPGTP